MTTPNYTSWEAYLKRIGQAPEQGGKRTYAPDPKPTPKKKKVKK